MLYIFLFFIPTLAYMAITKLYFNVKYTWTEFFVQAGSTFFVIALLFISASAFQAHDTMLVNGVVTNLEARKESCPSGWRSYRDSHCTEYDTRQVYSHTTCTGTGTNKVCTKHYDTEYRYYYPWETRYFVGSTLRSYEIRRVDSQGTKTPPRFAEISIGDPVTVSTSYYNYIKAAADSLFAEEKPVEPLPIAYPRIVDYYKSNRVIFTNTPSDSALWKSWNESLAKVNSNIKKTGGNVIIVVTDNKWSDLPEALARNWHAHNINDVVVVIGRTKDKIDWVDVRSWSGTSLVNVEIKNEILNLSVLNPETINSIIEKAMLDHFTLKDMKEFEYLAEDMSPPMWAFILASLILLIVTPLVTLIFHKHNIF